MTARPPWSATLTTRAPWRRRLRVCAHLPEAQSHSARTASRNARRHAVAAARSSSGVGRTSGSRSRSGSGSRARGGARAASASAAPRPGNARRRVYAKMGRGGDAAPGGARGGGAERGLEPGAEEDALDALLGEIFPRYRGGGGGGGDAGGETAEAARSPSPRRFGEAHGAKRRRQGDAGGLALALGSGEVLARGRSRARTSPRSSVDGVRPGVFGSRGSSQPGRLPTRTSSESAFSSSSRSAPGSRERRRDTTCACRN